MAEEVKVVGSTLSPFSSRVEIALKLKGIHYELMEQEDVYGNKSPELLKYNPVHKKIPVLVHNEKPFAESLVIAEYIDETWKEGHPILPEDPYERAMARFWARFVEEKCMLTIWKTFTSQGDEQKAIFEEARELLQELELQLEGKKYFGGEDIGLVDIIAVFIGFWLPILQQETKMELLTKEKFPRLAEWADRFSNHAIVMQVLPPKENLARVFRSKFSN